MIWDTIEIQFFDRQIRLILTMSGQIWRSSAERKPGSGANNRPMFNWGSGSPAHYLLCGRPDNTPPLMHYVLNAGSRLECLLGSHADRSGFISGAVGVVSHCGTCQVHHAGVNHPSVSF